MTREAMVVYPFGDHYDLTWIDHIGICPAYGRNKRSGPKKGAHTTLVIKTFCRARILVPPTQLEDM